MEQPSISPGGAPASPLSSPPFPVVGLGASAGGLQALQTFFDHTPPDPGAAFVVILHLSPDHESQAAALLQQHTTMPVTQVTAAVPVAPNHVYVIPPARRLAMVDGRLDLEDPLTEQDRRAPIDHFFRTLADTHNSRAAAIILSGTGSDGAVGVRRVKEHGGTILVQDPQEAEWDAMPRGAIASGLVDFVLPVAAMPEVLQAFWRRATQVALPLADGDGAEGDEAALREILALLRVGANHDFSRYKRPTILRRIGRRMQVSGVSDLAAYLELLRGRPEEVQALLQDLLISVTNFFRDRDAWTALEAIVPLLFAGKGVGDQVRVWVTACATGEEAYSVAMLLAEHAQTLDQPPQVQVFATDIDDAAIGRARQGSYPETIAGDVAPERLRQFFVLEQGHYRVKQELRELVLFAHHNVLRDPPFSKLDLITCRNLLIYLTREAQEQVVRLFHFTLRPGGYLLLGSAESLDGVSQLFDVVAKGQRLFRQRAVPAPQPPALPSGGAIPFARTPRPPAHTTSPGSLEELHRRQSLLHAPPSVIVNADYEIVHLSPGAGRFLQLQAGEPSVNLLRAAHPDLRSDLRTALFVVLQQGSRSERRHARVAFDDTVRLVDILVAPVEDGDWPSGYLFVSFADVGAAAGESSVATTPDAQVIQLEAELQRMREQLQTTIEAYETAGEEHKAANEELTAINEELRAAGEELETSKEELQAVNEELSTVNQELKHRIEEVSQANNDLQNLIAATEIATLFLNRELRLTRYTPSVEGIFNLIPSDLHRPLAHITHTLQYDQITADARQVLRSLQPVAREVATTPGQWYLMQLRPYRTTDDGIGGVVITFVDITERKRAEAALRASEANLEIELADTRLLQRISSSMIKEDDIGALYELFLDTARSLMHSDMASLQMLSSERNELFLLAQHGFTPESAAFWEWVRVDDTTSCSLALAHGEPVIVPDVELWDFVAGTEDLRHYRLSGIRAMLSVPLLSREGRLVGVTSTHWREVHQPSERELRLFDVLARQAADFLDRRMAQGALRASEQRFRAVVDLVPDLLWSNDPGGATDWYNQRWLEYTGQTLEQALGYGWVQAIHPEDRDTSLRNFQTAVDRGEPLRQEHRICRADGDYRWFLVQAQPLRDEAGQIVRWYGAATDVHEGRMALAAAEAALQTRDQFLSIASHELRTPLTPLLGYTGMLRQSLARAGAASEHKLVETIERQAQRLNTLIESLLDVSRLQRGQFALERRPLDLAALVAHVVDDFRLTLPGDGARYPLTLLGADAPAPVLGDAARLEEVLHNLLSNAVKYSPDGGAIRVRIARQDGEAMLEVADEGIGIPPEARARLFEPFYRASNIGSRVSGFGLGLYIVREIVERHGGRVEVDSAEGQGTTFRIWLPLSDA